VVENNNIALMPIRADITKTITRVTPLRFNVDHPITLRQRRLRSPKIFSQH
jgi:hypothetical protein